MAKCNLFTFCSVTQKQKLEQKQIVGCRLGDLVTTKTKTNKQDAPKQTPK
jgi:hypothetical protein